MTDFHIHIIPGVDDGAVDLSVSKLMAKTLIKQGVKKVVATSHYYPEITSAQEFLEDRKNGLEQLKHCGLTIYSAAEVLISPMLVNMKNLSDLCIEGTHWILIELPYLPKIAEKTFKQLENLISYRSMHIIIAHIDRYVSIRKNYKLLHKLREMGCLFQINCSLVMSKRFADRRFLKRLKKDGYIDLLGTDAHNDTTRPPDYSDAYKRLEKLFGNDVVGQIEEVEQMILSNKYKRDIIIV